jgi:hypothetical protein
MNQSSAHLMKLNSFESSSPIRTCETDCSLDLTRSLKLVPFDEMEDYVELKLSSCGPQDREVGIINYLVSLGIEMKTDPSAKWKHDQTPSPPIRFESTGNLLLRRRTQTV